MKMLLDDLHLITLLGICVVTSVFTVVAAARVREFVRQHEPTLTSRFDFAPRRPFLSLKSGPDRDLGEEHLFRWLHGGGAMELIEMHPNFSVRWKRYRRAWLASCTLICLWLVLVVSRFAQVGLNVG